MEFQGKGIPGIPLNHTQKKLFTIDLGLNNPSDSPPLVTELGELSFCSKQIKSPPKNKNKSLISTTKSQPRELKCTVNGKNTQALFSCPPGFLDPPSISFAYDWQLLKTKVKAFQDWWNCTSHTVPHKLAGKSGLASLCATLFSGAHVLQNIMLTIAQNTDSPTCPASISSNQSSRLSLMSPFWSTCFCSDAAGTLKHPEAQEQVCFLRPPYIFPCCVLSKRPLPGYIVLMLCFRQSCIPLTYGLICPYVL